MVAITTIWKFNGDNDNLVECNICNTIYKKWFEIISEESGSNINVLLEVIEVRDGVKE